MSHEKVRKILCIKWAHRYLYQKQQKSKEIGFFVNPESLDDEDDDDLVVISDDDDDLNSHPMIFEEMMPNNNN